MQSYDAQTFCELTSALGGITPVASRSRLERRQSHPLPGSARLGLARKVARHLRWWVVARPLSVRALGRRAAHADQRPHSKCHSATCTAGGATRNVTALVACCGRHFFTRYDKCTFEYTCQVMNSSKYCLSSIHSTLLRWYNLRQR